MLIFYMSLIDSDESKDKFESLYLKYRKHMKHIAMKILGDEHLAEDAVHNAFVKLISNLEKFNKIDCQETRNLIVIIIRSVSIDMYRKRNSLQEIQPKRDKLTVYAGPDCPDTEVVLLPVEVTKENTYEPSYITNGMPTKLNIEKDAWFRVGVNIQNPTEEDKIIHVTLKNISVRDSQEVMS